MTTDVGTVVTLGELLTRVRRTVPVHYGVAYPAVSVLKDGAGLGAKEPFVGGKTNYKALYRIHKGDVVVRTITAFESPVAVAMAHHHGSHVSQVFLTYEVLAAALPEYLRLVFQSPWFHEEMANRAQGSVLRRKTISDASFRAISIHLPTLPTQRRIVDLLAALDATLLATAAVVSQADLLLSALRTEAVEAPLGTEALGALARIATGPSWTQDQERPRSSAATRSVVGITHTKPDGTFLQQDFTHVEGLPLGVPTISPTSLLMIRTNGNRARIGNCYRTPPSTVGLTCSAFQMLLEPTDPADRDYLFHVLSSPPVQKALSASASGSTGLGNVAVSRVRELELAWPDRSVRDEFVATAEAILELRDDARAYEVALCGLRLALLDELLRGRRQVPDSYEDLLEAAS